MQVNMAEGTGREQRRPTSRLIITTALVVIGVVVSLLLVGVTLTPSANAVIALIVFGGMLGAFLVVQRRVGTGEPVVEEAVAGDESEL